MTAKRVDKDGDDGLAENEPDPRLFNDVLVGEELMGLSLLLRHWAAPSAVQKRSSEWPKKLAGFRRAVIAPKPPGSREAWPWEMVADEFEIIKEAVPKVSARARRTKSQAAFRLLLRDAVTFEIEVEGREKAELRRPFPVPPVITKRGKEKGKEETEAKGVQEGIDWAKSHREVAIQVTAARLGVGMSTVKSAIANDRKGGRRCVASDIQRHLASIYLDICSLGQDGQTDELRAMILDSLYASKYHVLTLTYLIQTAHKLTRPIIIGKHDAKEVRRLCSLALPEGGALGAGPFSERLRAEPPDS